MLYDHPGAWIAVGVFVTLVIAGLVESIWHRRNLRRIPIRIHVNGTRGKSGVTRLIAAGLRAGGIRTCAKTTGTLARLIYPDGSEEPVARPNRPNVIEQLRIVRTAVAERAEALVIECMALQPALQALCELRLIQATCGVITNARADHLDVMGPTSLDVAKALCGTVPRGGCVFTAERILLDVFRMAAADRESKLIAIGAEDVASVAHEDLAPFGYIEHAENVALALRVCEAHGVDRRAALRGMWATEPDSGAMTMHHLQWFSGRMVFINGFAANDPDSTGYNWKLVLARFPELRQRIAVFNCRADRTDRSEQLADACLDWPPADHYLVIGSGTAVFFRRAKAGGLDPRLITCMEGAETLEIVNAIIELVDDAALVVGMGNIGGPGLPLIEYFVDHDSGGPAVMPMNAPHEETLAKEPA